MTLRAQSRGVRHGCLCLCGLRGWEIPHRTLRGLPPLAPHSRAGGLAQGGKRRWVPCRGLRARSESSWRPPHSLPCPSVGGQHPQPHTPLRSSTARATPLAWRRGPCPTRPSLAPVPAPRDPTVTSHSPAAADSVPAPLPPGCLRANRQQEKGGGGQPGSASVGKELARGRGRRSGL